MVNVLGRDGRRYLGRSPGDDRVGAQLAGRGAGELQVPGATGRDVRSTELADVDKLLVLREYLRRWSWEVGKFFEGVDKDNTDAELAAAAPGFPVFALDPRSRALTQAVPELIPNSAHLPPLSAQ